MFGIIDLASIPKDRYYLYRSVWRPQEETIHILPHWNWKGREGEVTPVFVYTNYDSGELFVNGKSYGVRHKNSNSLLERYRLMWNDVLYEPGEVRFVAYSPNGSEVASASVRTAGAPDHIVLTPSATILNADGKDLSYINVSVVDKDGNLCTDASGSVRFQVSGKASFRAAANGDPTCLDLFHTPDMHLFGGQLTAIIQSGTKAGKAIFKASAEGLPESSITIRVRK